MRHIAILGLDATGLDAKDIVTTGLGNLNLATAGHLEPLEGARILNAVRNSHINADAFTSVLHSTASGAVAWQPRSPAQR